MSELCSDCVECEVPEKVSTKEYAVENLIEKARAGRTRALENRVERESEAPVKSTRADRKSRNGHTMLPVFVSSRTRELTPAYLH